MKAILIDASAKTVTEVTLEDDHKEISKHIGCRTFTLGADIGEKDCVYVDDEGLLDDSNAFFFLPTLHQPFAGNGLILGIDYNTGESQDTSISLEAVKRSVKFLSAWDIQLRYRG